ncbi:MAG: enoyl-CoA hydratase/isomerase family protein [Bernardetiaceae bacterium]
MKPTTVGYQRHERVAVITLNRPEKRNAFNQNLVEELTVAFERAQNDPTVAVVLLASEGKSFCAGADLGYLQQLQGFSYEENLADSTRLKELFARIYHFPKVVVGAVQGHALAGGCGLVTVCDYVWSVSAAKFGYTEVKIGFVPAIVMPFLVRKIGQSRARALLLTGDWITAQQALEYGIVHQIVETTEELQTRSLAFAQHLAQTNSSNAMQLTKKMLLQTADQDTEAAIEEGAELNARARQTPDCQRGIAAFLNKEKIIW